MKTKILIGMIVILGVFLVGAIYENFSLKGEIRELGNEQEITSRKIVQQNSIINYLVQNSNTSTKNINSSLSVSSREVLPSQLSQPLSEGDAEAMEMYVPVIAWSKGMIESDEKYFKYTYRFDEYTAHISFDHNPSYNYETNTTENDWFQIYSLENGDVEYPAFFITNDPQSCHLLFCEIEKIDTFETEHHTWDYLGYIKPHNIHDETPPSDHVFRLVIDDMQIYAESTIDPREVSNKAAHEIFNSFKIEIK